MLLLKHLLQENRVRHLLRLLHRIVHLSDKAPEREVVVARAVESQ